MGHVLSEKGLSPDYNKVRTISSLKAPTNIKELRSFLGMITYCAKFLPNFATITEPLRKLTKKDARWEWSTPQQTAFEKLKIVLSTADTLAYFNPKAETEVVTDASPYGLGAVIAQKQPCGNFKPVSYASRSLSSVERRYSQIERELLLLLVIYLTLTISSI